MSAMGGKGALHVIEASAGTGKTFRITELVVGLVASGKAIDRIVLSSYTNAAADELAERVRGALARAIDPRAHGDTKSPVPEGSHAALLRRAMAEIDGACIGTIHSFCARLLEEAAEVAGPLSLEGMSPDEAAGDLQAEVTADLWAACVAPSELAISMLGDGPADAKATLARIVSAVDGEPDALIEPSGDWIRAEELVRRIDDVIAGDGAACRAAVADVAPHFNTAARQCLNAMADVAQPSPAAREAVLQGAHALRPVPGGDWPAEAHKAKRGRVQEWARTEPGMHAVRVLQGLHEDHRAACAGLRAALARRAREALRARRDARRTYSFGDLIARTWRLVSAPGSALVAHARSRYEVAIIDECQDTDPLQQAIFSRIFDAPGCALHVVGDPKQSIYGFRGADLPSYIRLRDRGTAEAPLTVSHRSDAAHVAAVEGLFAGSANPFGETAIAFAAISAKHVTPRCVSGDDVPRSGIDAIALDAGTSVSSQRAAAMRATAAQIRAWLAWPAPCGLAIEVDGRGAGDRRPVRPGDIAVLCQRRDELDAMRAELDLLGIPSVYSGDSSVLLTPAAEDVHAILMACASRRSPQLAVGAAMTRALGATADDLRQRRESWIGAIRACARTIGRAGIDAALVELLERPIPDVRSGADEGCSAMELLLAQPGGERHAVDLQHLRELLGEAERTGTHGAAALAQWIRTERDSIERAGGRGGGDTARLRTQATKDAVTLQTLHSSKGLTYGLVCLPTLAMGTRRSKEPSIVRTAEAGADGAVSRIIDLGSPAQAARAQRQLDEQQREQSRLLYVAVTRARYVTSVCVPLERAALVAPSALEGLLSAPMNGGGAAKGDRLAQLESWAARSDAAYRRLHPPAGALAGTSGHADARGTAVRIIREVPAWSGDPWCAPAAGDIAPLDAPCVAWADALREVSFTSLARSASHVDAGSGHSALPQASEANERAEPDAATVAQDAADGAEAGAPGSASQLDAAIRRLGVRGVDLGVAMHAALDVAFESIADAGDGAAVNGPPAVTRIDDRLASEIALRCASLTGGEATDGMRISARDAARAIRSALAQPLRYGCPSVVRLAGQRDAVLRELRISVPLALSHESLADAFGTFGGDVGARIAPALARVSPDRMRGLLSGIIDVAACTDSGDWHIIDWKTNDLGEDPGAYAGNALEDAAASSLYPMQAALYMMLLTRWLRRIGQRPAVVAAHYLYLRGMDAQSPGAGIWSWSPGAPLIAALEEAVGAHAELAPGGVEA